MTKRHVNFKGFILPIITLLSGIGLIAMSFCIYFLADGIETYVLILICAMDFIFAFYIPSGLLKNTRVKKWRFGFLISVGYIGIFIAAPSLGLAVGGKLELLQYRIVDIVFYAFFTVPCVVFGVAPITLIRELKFTRDPNRYDKLKSDIIELNEYIKAQYDLEANHTVDCVLAEMNDLLLGIESGQIIMTNTRLMLASTWASLDGAFDDKKDDKKLVEMIYRVQDDIHALEGNIIVREEFGRFSRKRDQHVNTMFPNLNCESGILQYIAFSGEDRLKIKFPNGYLICLSFDKNAEIYIIRITNADPTNILEEQRFKLFSQIEGNLQRLVYKYESL